MGYFSNQSEADAYISKHCAHCQHAKPENGGCFSCPVMEAHLLFNYEECNNDKSILDTLIPRHESGIGNGKCRMFIAWDEDRCEETIEMFEV